MSGATEQYLHIHLFPGIVAAPWKCYELKCMFTERFSHTQSIRYSYSMVFWIVKKDSSINADNVFDIWTDTALVQFECIKDISLIFILFKSNWLRYVW